MTEAVLEERKEEVKQEVQELTESERMLNLGIPVTLKKLGKVQVKELSLEDTIVLARELSIVFSALDMDIEGLPSEKKGLEWFMRLLSDPLTHQALRSVIAASTERDSEDYVNMGVSDWLKVFAALKSVVDWEEMKELFFQIVPLDTVKNWRTMIQSKQGI